MNKLSIIFAIIALAIFAPTQAHAFYFVDTGAGPNTGSGTSLDANQWLGAKFATTEAHTVYDIQGWINIYGGGGSLTYSIYGDSYVPQNLLFSTSYNAPAPTVSNVPKWVGPSGLNWDLAAGTYWVTFEVLADQNFDGSMPHPAENPLLTETFFNQNNNGWSNVNLDIAVRIGDNPGQGSSTIPEPATMFLFTSGLVGAFIKKGRKA